MPGFDQLYLSVALSLAAVASAAVALAQVRRAAERALAIGQLYAIAAPVGPDRAEPFFRSLHALLRPVIRRQLRGQPWIALELCAREGLVGLQIWIPRVEESLVTALLRAACPEIELTPIATEPIAPPGAAAYAALELAGPSDVSIRTTFPADPLSGVVAALAAAGDDVSTTLQLLVRPRSAGWQRQAARRAREMRDGRGWTILGTGATIGHTALRRAREQAAAIEAKAASPGFDCALRIAVGASGRASARDQIRAIAASVRPYAGANHVRVRPGRAGGRLARRCTARSFSRHGTRILTPAELAVLWHLPTDALPQLATIHAPALPLPRDAGRGERILGRARWHGDERVVGLSIADSRHHLHLLGPTGTGKSTALLNLAAQDIAAGRGVAVLDPKGDLVAALLARIPAARMGDVLLIAPDDALIVGINPLACAPGDDPELIAENTLTIFKRIYERSWGMRTDDILKSALLTLLRRPGSTLAHIPLLLTDAAFRTRILREVHDPLGLDLFWHWFNQLSEAQRNEAIGPVLNKLRDFLIRTRLRRMLCQPSATVDLRTVVERGQILLADLSVGRWGETPSALVGSFLIATLWQAVLARAAQPEERRPDFFLFIDEFQQFLGIAGPFADALAQARSLHLSLTIANQHLGQLSSELREAIASNARSRAVFQCGQDDATALARQFAPLDARALMNLQRFAMAARVSIGGQTSAPFTLRTLPPMPVADRGRADAVRAAAAARYGRPAADLDRELQAALGPTAIDREAPETGVGRPRPR